MKKMLVSPESVGMSSERLARIRPVLDRYVQTRGFAGISVLLSRRGKLVHFEQAGYQDRGEKTPMAPDTIFRIYSMTKPVVCTALMMLYEEARFQLYDPVAKYLPGFAKLRVLCGATKAEQHTAELTRPITVQDLMRHTAGLTYDFLEDSPAAELYREARIMADGGRSLQAMVAEITRLPLAYQPGTRWHYSVATDVVAHLIEVLADMPLQQFLAERVFKPLGMAETGFSVPAKARSRIATMYGHPDLATHTFSQIFAAWAAGSNGQRDVESTHPCDNGSTFARGGHGLFSTASDYLRFARMLLNRGELDGVRVIGPRVLDLMHMNHLPAALLPYEIAGIRNAGYGFGLGSRVHMSNAESALPSSVGEYGWSGAAKTFYWVDPKEQLVGLLLSQFMVSIEQPDKDLLTLAYQALID